MLLLENGDDAKQITVEKFAQLMGIPSDVIEKLKKNPVFEINPQKTRPDKLNGGFIAPAGKGSKPYFFKEIDGITCIIRYYKSRVPDKVNPRISTYDPKRVMFEDMLSIYPELDLAMFMYCLPTCADSPNPVKDWHYTFQNKEKKAIGIRDNAAKISKALALVNNEEANGGLSDNDILLTAKGIYAQNTGVKVIPNPSQKNKTVIEVRADLTQLIFKDVDLFLDSADSDVNEFYGMVQDAVDRGIFIIKQSPNSSVRSWYWEGGSQSGKLITDIPSGQNDFDMLKAAIEADPNKYYQNVIKALAETKGRESMASFLKSEKAKLQVQAQAPKAAAPPKNKLSQADFVPEGANNLIDDEEEKDEFVEPPADNFDENDAIDPGSQFEMPTSYNELGRIVQAFNGGKFVQSVNKQVWDLVKDQMKENTLTIDLLKQTIDEVLAAD